MASLYSEIQSEIIEKTSEYGRMEIHVLAQNINRGIQATILNVLQPACEDARFHLPVQPRLALCRRRRRLRPRHRSRTRPPRLRPTHVVLHPPQPRRVMPLHIRVDLAPAVSQLPLELRDERQRRTRLLQSLCRKPRRVATAVQYPDGQILSSVSRRDLLTYLLTSPRADRQEPLPMLRCPRLAGFSLIR